MTDARKHVWFHIGAPKSGTTFLQHVLWRNRNALAAAGMLHPGTMLGDHMLAALSLRGVGFHGQRPERSRGAWARVVSEIADWPGPSAIIDHELFSPAASRWIARAARDLAFAEVHIVYTCRDLARVLPSAWQERTRSRDDVTYEQFLAAVTGPRHGRDDPDIEAKRISRGFWDLYDSPAILARWAEYVPPERIHVVTVPPRGAPPALLWERFASTIGLEPGAYDLDVARANTSLGAAEAAVLHELNIAIGGDEFPWPVYNRLIKQMLATRFAGRRGLAIDLPEPVYAWTLKQAQAMVKTLDGTGYDVVGDLAELVPTERPTGVDPDQMSDAARAEAAVAGMAALAEEFAAEVDRATARTAALEDTVREAQRHEARIAELEKAVRRARERADHATQRAQRAAAGERETLALSRRSVTRIAVDRIRGRAATVRERGLLTVAGNRVRTLRNRGG